MGRLYIAKCAKLSRRSRSFVCDFKSRFFVVLFSVYLQFQVVVFGRFYGFDVACICDFNGYKVQECAGAAT